MSSSTTTSSDLCMTSELISTTQSDSQFLLRGHSRSKAVRSPMFSRIKKISFSLQSKIVSQEKPVLL